MASRTAPPRGLSPPSRRLWRTLAAGFDLESHHLAVLEEACRALDRAREAREVVDRDGLTQFDRFDQLRPHPLLTVERDQRALAGKLLKDLNLDAEIPGPPGRPGRRT